MFNPYQNVMLLSIWIEGKHYDMMGKYIKPSTVVANKDKHEVELNGVKLHLEPDRIMDAEQYFGIVNGKIEGKLPEKASKKLYFLEHD